MTLDPDLVRRAAGGDDRAFTALAARLQDNVFRVALGMLGEEHLADEVTQLVLVRLHRALSGDLLLGGQLIPAGAYTLYTAISPDNSRYALVVNKQVGQWGTSYDVARDLVRIPMRAGAAPPTEQFTIRVEPSPSASAGALRLVWDRTELAVELRPAP